MLSDVAEYYRDLLSARSWYAEGLSWTVIEPANQQVTVDEVMRRLHAEPVRLDEIQFPHVNDRRPGDPDEMLVAHLAQAGTSVMMFQPLGFEGSRREVLRRLSDGTRVHNVDWSINGNGGITYAVYGKVLTWIDKNDPDRRWGDDPSLLDEDLADLRTARQLRDTGDWPAARLADEAAALATVERRTGLRLTADWVDNLDTDPWRTVMIGHIPADPHPPTRFGLTDPDLDARLWAAPEPVRRAALTLLTREVTAHFTFTDPETAAAALDAIAHDRPLDPDTRTRVFHLGATTDTPNANPRSVPSMLHLATAPPDRPGDRLDAFHAAQHALPTEWPHLRRALSALLRPSTN